MNNLAKQIWDRYGNFELSHDKNEAIVKNIQEFVEKHSVGFAKWLSENYSTSARTPNKWLNKYGGSFIKTEELFKLYTEQLCQEQ